MNHLTKNKIILYLAAIFLVGGVTGGVLGWTGANRNRMEPPSPKGMCDHFRHQLKSELDLTPAQLQQLDPTHEYFAGSSLEVFPANLGTLYGLRDAVSYDSLQSLTRVEALAAAGYDRVTHSLPLTPNPAMASLGIRWIVTPSGIVEVPHAQHPPPPRNDPPEGIGWGMVVSAIGAGLSVVSCLWLNRTAPRIVSP